MNRTKLGVTLSEYAIIIALISLAIITACLVFRDQILSTLTAYSNQYGNMHTQMSNNTNTIANNTASNNINNTFINNNKVTCENNNCSVDFGDYVINNIPQDLNKLVETSGVSGGMDNLVNLLDQIAQQYETQGKTEEAKDIKILATTGHNMAVIQKSFEDYVYNVCKGDETCLKNHTYQYYPKPAKFDETYQKFPTNVTYYDAPYLTNIGVGVEEDDYPEDSISVFYNKTLRKIKESGTISDSTKGIIRELTWDIGTISQKWLKPFAYLTTKNFENDNYYTTYDPLTGVDKRNYYDQGSTFTNVFAGIKNNLKAPELTHIDSGLICAAGSYTDTGTSCH